MKMTKIKLKILGMHCASCVSSIENNIGSLKGIDEINVNLATEKALIDYDQEIINIDNIIEEINSLGYDVKLDGDNVKKVRFNVKDMSCSSCAKAIEDNLSDYDGIIFASINFATEKLNVEFDKSMVSVSDIIDRVNMIGYTIELEGSDKSEDDEVANKSKKRLIYSSILAGTIMTLMIIDMFLFTVPFFLEISAILGFPVVFIIGFHVHKGSFKSILNKSPNMDVLVSMGTIPPYLIGLLSFFFDIQSFIGMSAMIMTFHLIGKYLEDKAKGKASKAIKKLIEMGAKTANVIIDGDEKEVPVEELEKEDIMIVRPGEKVPTDGVIIEGSALIDESMATGESVPVEKSVNDEVIGATIIEDGMIKVKVTKLGKETFLSQIIDLVEECQGSKVPIQEFADKVTGYFVPIILVLSVLTFFSFIIFSSFHISILEWGSQFLPWVNPNLPPLTLAFITATAVLVIACPCALGLGTPTALMVGSGIGAKKGILIKNGEVVQTIKDVKAIAYDKTGTITKGKPEVIDVDGVGSFSNLRMLKLAASLENASQHPLGKAVVSKAKEEDLNLFDVSNFKSISGKGVKGIVDNKEVIIGSPKFMDDLDVDYSDYLDKIHNYEKEAKTTVLVSVNKRLVGIITISDPIKEDSINAIKEFKKLGIKTIMITGDNKRTANAIADIVGVDEVVSEVLPDEKVNEIKKLQDKFGLVAMVGDGINDAPALKQANVGVAIGTGTDIAIESSDMTLVSGNLSSLVSGFNLSNAIFKKIKENYFWAWFYNAIAIPIAMIGLLHPLIGAAAMSFSSLNVIFNSLRLRNVDIDPDYE